MKTIKLIEYNNIFFYFYYSLSKYYYFYFCFKYKKIFKKMLGDLKKQMLNIRLIEKESKLMKTYNKLKQNIFDLFYELLKYYNPSLNYVCISLFLQYFQLMYYPFSDYVRIIIKKYSLKLNGNTNIIFHI